MAVVDIQLRYVSQTDHGAILMWLVSPSRPPLVLEAWGRLGGIERNERGWYSLHKLSWRRYSRDGFPVPGVRPGGSVVG